MVIGLVVFLTTTTVSHAFFFDSIFGTSAPKPVTTTTKSTINGNTGIALDYMAHKVCPKHLTRNKYLMYYSYVKRCYTFVISDQADWFTAKEDCSAKSGNLMNIHSSLENFFLGMRDKVALGNGNTYVWIGLSDTSSPGHFSWTNGPLKTYKHWHTGQPASGFPGNTCAAYNHDSLDWWTFPCNSTKLGWVCEFELNSTMTTTTLTTLKPSTSESTITKPTTPELTTAKPTSKPTTPKPTTPKPTTPKPTTPKPTTPEPTTPKPTTPKPTTPKPTTPEPTTPKPTTPKPTTPEPTTPKPKVETTPPPTTTTTEEAAGIIIIG
ncbi:salivary glue protein Sgs-3-like [Ostrea edulis]|uniref:salivary glue protein Sgs-3-like n=1 Tax=Ostrea edulis TaxID=37623 RepID=UPI002095688A|nr:salivary glue protein Sgs-3-like [Ostrea edulis]